MSNNIGIYIMYYEGDDFEYYIGKSINIKKRYEDHCSALIRGSHHNKNLQKLFNIYNTLPSHYLLEIVGIDLLNIREAYWISEFSSFNTGMNLTPGGDGVGIGHLHPGALYSQDTYFNILHELAYTEKSLSLIAREVGVSRHIVKNISSGLNHTYLEEHFPVEYKIVLNKQGTRSSSIYEEEEYLEVVLLLANTNSTMLQISEITGITVSVIKGISQGLLHKDIEVSYPLEYKRMIDKLHTKYVGPRDGTTYPLVISPEGVVYKVTHAKDFSIKHGLDNSTFNKLLRSKTNAHKGWKRYEENDKNSKN